MGEHASSNLNDLLILDRTRDWTETDALYPFALDELLCRRTGEGGPAVCHLWRHPRAFVMGSRDSRLPGAAAAKRWLESAGYDVVVRNSGGAAVPLDLGVVNLSLVLPQDKVGDFGFRRDFERMYELIREALAGTGRPIEKGEVQGAYCPGDFDLSVGGLKFCGIAQRRQTKACIVQAFVVAEGSGRSRARLVREFYERAAGEETDASKYPQVTEDSMASLAECVGIGLGAAEIFAEEVKRVVRARQTEEGLAAAAAKLRLPQPEEVRELARKMRANYFNELEV
jgi:octanoyl-[GcvH]:protein N-octanoyltransferase